MQLRIVSVCISQLETSRHTSAIISPLDAPRIQNLVERGASGHVENLRALLRKRRVDLILQPDPRVRAKLCALILLHHCRNKIPHRRASAGQVSTNLENMKNTTYSDPSANLASAIYASSNNATFTAAWKYFNNTSATKAGSP